MLTVVKRLQLHINKLENLRGSSCIALSAVIASRKVIINPCNQDQQYFKWAILGFYVEGQWGHECINQHYLDMEARFDFTGLAFPTPLYQLLLCKQKNPGFDTNMYANEGNNTIIPIWVSKEEQATYFDLFLMMTEDGNAHYCLPVLMPPMSKSNVCEHTMTSCM
ncbi:hypothetical protein PR048_017710 [Dryococelus australis]|uniref:Uncharacterized protein n=1 Tax=Dryococelus australis TaxID=614101 RepID=A0ABQ9HA96_9NEOP|nr:hypothetical protein PR048_017710 [Dryococelus australis]